MDFQDVGWDSWTGLIRLRIEADGGLLQQNVSVLAARDTIATCLICMLQKLYLRKVEHIIRLYYNVLFQTFFCVSVAVNSHVRVSTMLLLLLAGT